jgi:hypothetical protein
MGGHHEWGVKLEVILVAKEGRTPAGGTIHRYTRCVDYISMEIFP